MNLDIGCGKDKKATIGLDIDKDSDADIIADGRYLPFQDQVFDTVVSHHCIEHLPNPLKLLREMNRVSEGKVILRLPSEFSISGGTQHFYRWNPTELQNLLQLVFLKVETGYTGRLTRIGAGKPFLRVMLSKMGLHDEIYAICRKG